MKLIEMILSRVSRKALVSIIAPIALLVVLLTGFKVYLMSAFPESALKEYITAVIKDNFNKAVTFDDAYVSIWGTVVISNLNISISSDFNDNVSLVKCGTVSLRVRFFSIFSRRLVIKGIVFEDPDITLHKKYGKGYLDTFGEIFSLTRPLGEISQIDRDYFRIEIDNSRVLYKEVFRDDTLLMKMERVSATIILRTDVLSYEMGGRILPLTDANLGRASFTLTGKIRIGAGNRFVASVNTLRLADLDLTYLNPYLRENLKDSLVVGGGMDAAMEMSTLNDNASVSGRVEVTNLEALEVRPNNERVHYVSHENLNLDLLLDAANGFGRIIFRQLEVYDESLRLVLNGIYNRNGLEHYFDVAFQSNSVDLGRFSENITPLKGATFGGRLQFGGRVRYDLLGGNSRGISLALDLDNFSMKRSDKRDTREAVRLMNVKLALKDDQMRVSLHAALESSEFDVSWEAYVKKWSPFSSESFITVKSPLMDLGDLAAPVRLAVEYLYEGAYDDRKIGYENIVFRNEPLGEFLNANNVRSRVEIKKVALRQRASLSDLTFDAGLKDGRAYLENFTAAGYNAAWTLQAEGQFNLWQPVISIKAAVKNMDLASFGSEAGVKGRMGGVLNAELSYQLAAYRLAQILEYAIVDVSVEVANGSLKNTPIQDRLTEFLKKQGAGNPDIGELEFPSFSFNFVQRAENYQVAKLAMDGPKLRFYTRGTYDYRDGLNVPLELSFAQAGQPQPPATAVAAATASLEIKGPLAMPVLQKAKGRNDKGDKPVETLTLFKVD